MSNPKKQKTIVRLTPTSSSSEVRGECKICTEVTILVHVVVGKTKPCNHPPKYCQECVSKHIEAEVNNKGRRTDIPCPSNCGSTLEFDDIRRLARKNVFEFYDKQLMNKMLRDLPTFRWCKNSKCGSGQECIDGENNNIIKCHACHQLSCYVHDIPWHYEMTCSQYDASISQEEVAANKQFILSRTKPCPKCGTNIEKNDGCDHMTCKLPGGCGHEFCWLCLATYSDILRDGNHRHEATCTYYAAYDENDV
eukprot:c4641_g1_i1.p1 GENE.c4641_g1_i1~~c4641_g1_i1.p1  ORF type:complete len:262 (-),score=70.17 c4641_g1_i1:10-762(-)